ncbi:MAG: ATP-binding cassette domain-containing protein [Candidatus Latescibacterota bacterium]|jgi:putative ABC transport system ATP-binding protein
MRIDLQNVSLRFGDHEPLFEGVDLKIEGGDFVVIEGSSGVGKSSLLRLLNRLQEPTTGQVLVDNAPPRDADITRLRRRAVLVPQTPIMGPGTVRENLCWPLIFRANHIHTLPGDEVLRQRLDELLLQDTRLDDEARTLSVGQRQRLALLRALLLDPEILLCDEPTAALDGEARAVLEAQLDARCSAGTGVVVVTHQGFAAPTTGARRVILQRQGLQVAA